MIRRGVTTLLALALLAGPAMAQTTADAPLIQLAPMPAETPPAPAVPPVAVPPVAVPPAAAAPEGEAPLIDLGPAAPLPGDPVLAAPVEPPERDDGVAPATAPTADWILTLVPAAQPVPTEVRIGGSMPQPGQFRLSGETASADFLLTVPDGGPPPTELLLSLRSSVNVLPDDSQLTVWINGAEAGTITLDNIGPFMEQRLPVSTLTPGVNMIRLTVVQTHRIFCGPEASFAVWTEIDLGHSGVQIDPALLPLTPPGFLAALQSQVARGGAVEILADESTDIALVRDVARRITDALGGSPRIELLPFYSMDTGREARARVALIGSTQPMASVRRGAGGALVLQIEHAGGTPPDLSDMLPLQPSEWGIATLTPGAPTQIADLGAPEILANTHYFRQDVDFLLPEDWLLLASQKAEFTIHYGFSADLPEGSLLLFKINGQTVRLLPLDRDGGKVLPPLDIGFRANRLNPGVNTLTFEMSVPGDPPDLPCTPRSTDMMVILGDSTLSVPPSPRMQQTDMSRSLARLDGNDVVIPAEVANPARDQAAILAFGALFRPLMDDGIEARLHVVTLDAAGLVPAGDTGVTRRMLQNAVYPALDLQPALQAAAPAEAPAAPVSGFSLADADGVATEPEAAPEDDGPSAWDSVTRFFSTEGWLFQEVGGVRDLAFPGTITLPKWLEGKSGRALLLQLDPETPNDIWLVAGPDITMTDLAERVDSFRRAGRGEVHGQAALLMNDGTWITWSEKRRPDLMEPLTPQNLRAVLGNYASWSPLIFTLLTLGMALLSVIPALFFVLITRRSGSRT